MTRPLIIIGAIHVAGLQRGGISHDFFVPDNCQSTEYPDGRWY